MRLRVSLNRVGAMGWVGPKLYCRNSSDHTRSVFAGICSTYPEIAEATNAEGGSVRSERVAFLARPRDWLDDVARRSPARLSLSVFAGVIAVVTALLQLPIATAAGTRAPFVDSLFTATSAVSVTGLVTVDSATYWSTFGHGVIMVGIMVGGLGVMTLASILALAVSRHIGLTQRLLAQVETKTEALGEVGTLVRAVIIASLAITTTLSFAFIPRFLTLGFGLGESIWHGWFKIGRAASEHQSRGHLVCRHPLQEKSS